MNTTAPGVGHNSNVPEDKARQVAYDRLRSLVERIERLHEERKELGNDVRDIFAEAKSAGYDPKVLRQLLALRRKDPNDLAEEEALLDTYRQALGM